jgi:hypothetical protein
VSKKRSVSIPFRFIGNERAEKMARPFCPFCPFRSVRSARFAF